MSSAAFFEVTDPPYRIRTLSDTFVPKVVFKSLRMAFAASGRIAEWPPCRCQWPRQFVGHDEFGGLFFVEIAGDVSYLAHGEIEFNALTSFLEAFADAQNRLHAGGEHGTYLIDDIGVIFRMVFAAFGVADDDV